MKTTILLLTTSMMLLASVAISQGEISISDAIEKALKIEPGKAVSAVLKRTTYHVDIQTEDGKKTVYIDELSGKAVDLKILSVDEAVEIALNIEPGKVEKVEFEKSVYEIKVKKEKGQRAKLYIDSFSGEILKHKKWKQKD